MKRRAGITGSRGFTLTEIAIVLAIVGLILGAIWVAAKSVLDSSRANQAVQDISTMAANMRSTFAATTTLTSAGAATDTKNMISAGIIPNNLVASGGTTATNSWEGAVTITLASTDARHFRIIYAGTPYDACFKIASQLANLGTSDAPVNLITNTTNVVPIPNLGTPDANCTGQATGLCSKAIDAYCTLNGSGSTLSAAASTGFDYTIH